jgi:Xaa-Pro aminopeptidase
VLLTRSPVADAKSIKNEVEIEGFRQCHVRDGVALVNQHVNTRNARVKYFPVQVRYFAWLEDQLLRGVKMNENQAADQLEIYRRYEPVNLNSCIDCNSTH